MVIKAGILFPGQGAQSPGMGAELAESSRAARKIFQQADDILGFSLAALCFEGPADELIRTDRAQPAIFTCSIATLAALEECTGAPFEGTMAAGLSLGEYSALTAANVLTFEEGLRLVALRGSAMQAASEDCPSGMTSVLGLGIERTKSLCSDIAERTGKTIQIANLNSPGQIVVSGENEALDAFEAEAPTAGAKRAIRLDVAGAFHSEVMRPAANSLLEALNQVEFKEPQFPIWQNATAQPGHNPQLIKDNLATQLTSTVLWEDSFRAMASESDDAVFIEPAPGRVLTGLARRIAPQAEVISLQTPQDLQTFATSNVD